VSEGRPGERALSIGQAWPWALAVVAALVLFVGVTKAWPFTVDDTYITLRYSRNVAQGLGPTFNATGPRAEGYTTLLWMLLLVVPHGLGLDAVAFAKGLGVVATFATLLVAARWAWAEGKGDNRDAGAWAGATAATCFAAIPATAVHAVSGMETALFTLLLTAMFASAGALVRDDPRGHGPAAWRVILLALLTGLTRPEGNLAALLVVGAIAARLTSGARLAFVLRAAVAWALPIGAYELWRRSYYGLTFPLPFYVKLATPGVLPGLPDVSEWLRGPALHFGLLLVPVLVRPSRTLVPALLATGALTLFFVLPQHQMGYDHRYLAPLDPTLCVIAGVGLSRLVTRAARWPVAAVNAGAAAAVVVAAGLEAVDARAVIAGEVDYGHGLADAHERLGRDLLAIGMPAGRLVISDAGAVPYFSQWWTLDLVGLNDATVATTGRRDPAWVLAQNPDVVVLASPRTDRVEPWDWNPWEPSLYDACISAGFVRVGLRRFADDYWLWVLARPDSIAGTGLLARR
jgi:arabinofuranosyltransferase